MKHNIPNLNLLDLYLLKMNEMLYEFNQVPLYKRENHHAFIRRMAKELRKITIANDGYVPHERKRKGKD